MNTKTSELQFEFDATPAITDRWKYPPGFFQWFMSAEGIAVWQEFERRALTMAQRRDRYSARTIMEVIRWETELKDGSVLFKISNNWVPGLARYWMRLHGKRYPRFFSLHGGE